MILEEKLSFIRIPKNASTSIYEHVKHFNLITDSSMKSMFSSEKFMSLFAPSHCFLSEAVSVLGVDILKYPVFCVIRNPYDRMVSQFCFAQKMRKNLPNKFKESINSFKTFVDFCYKNKDNPNNLPSIGQSEYLDVDCKINKLRFENLQKDFENFVFMNRISGIKTKIPHLNQTQRKNHKHYYDKNTQEKVYKLWEQDFKKFNYDKEL